jgi:hypothetical protein
MPYVEAFIDGDKQPIADVFGAFSLFGVRIVQELADLTGQPPETLMEKWLLFSAEHDPNDPNAPPPAEPG